MGSRSGADAIIGDHTGTTLMGFGGADALRANGGADWLIGGAEADRLWGGAGDDVFVLQSPEDGGDITADWGRVAGNDDRFELALSGFGAGLALGSLAASRFVTRTSGNLAQDADDRFVFRDSYDTLWFDSNGNGAGEEVLLADLQAGAVVTAGDIWMV